MLKIVLWYLKHLFTLPWSPRGRRMRIEKLMRHMGEDRDTCAAVIYARDSMLGRRFSDEEVRDASRLQKLLEQREITLPIDRKDKSGRV